MNLKKVKSHLKSIADLFESDLPDNEEFLIIAGNMLRQFAIPLISSDEKFSNLNIDDANQVALASMQNPTSVSLAVLLQSHVLIKLSESFKNE